MICLVTARHRKRTDANQDSAEIWKIVEDLQSEFGVSAECERVESDEGDVSFNIIVGDTTYLILPEDEPGLYAVFRAQSNGELIERARRQPAKCCMTTHRKKG